MCVYMHTLPICLYVCMHFFRRRTNFADVDFVIQNKKKEKKIK